MRKSESKFLPIEQIEKAIFLIRGHKVMLDSDLAEVYGTTTKRLNEQVRRNQHRFPEDFMFRLSNQEVRILRSQFATSRSWGGRRTNPCVFTEHGAVMLASVLDSDVAIEASVQIVRTFIRMREMIVAHKDLVKRLDDLERKYDAQFKVVFNSIREIIQAKPKALLELPKKKQTIGFGRE